MEVNVKTGETTAQIADRLTEEAARRHHPTAARPSPKRHDIIKPLCGMVLCQVIDDRPRDAEGRPVASVDSKIIMPDTVHIRPDCAKVLAVSDGVHTSDGALIKPEAAAGDLVIFNPYAITRILDNAGQVANAQGSPYAGPGDRFLIAQNQLLGKVI